MADKKLDVEVENEASRTRGSKKFSCCWTMSHCCSMEDHGDLDIHVMDKGICMCILRNAHQRDKAEAREEESSCILVVLKNKRGEGEVSVEHICLINGKGQRGVLLCCLNHVAR